MRSLTSTASLALLLGVGAMAAGVPTAGAAYVGVDISANFAPPPLPYYDQPRIPGDGYIWTPGYWAWDQDYEDYYWVPGAWVLPPRVGYLWTPGYWGWDDGAYLFNPGYWGPQIGYYGGINYGFGYNGFGYFGGEWRRNHFYYNRSANNVRSLGGDNVYERNFSNANGYNRTSFNGGRGGIQARPTPEQIAVGRGPRIGFTPMQRQHIQLARSQPSQRASFNHGAPPIAATARPGGFSGPGVVAARGAGPVRAGPAAREFRPGPQPGEPYGGQRPGGPPSGFRPGAANERPGPGPRQGEFARPEQGRPPQPFDRPNGERPSPRPQQGEFARPEQGGPPQSFDRQTREGPGPQPRFDRPPPQAQFARPAPPQAQFARPAPQAMRPPPQAPRPAPQQPHPQPQAHPAPAPGAHEEHPH